MNILGFAEQFEEETRAKMQKDASKFRGIDLIMDKRRVIGLIAQENCNKEFFVQYELVTIEDLKPCLRECKEKERRAKELVASHSYLEYHLSVQMLGIVYQFLENNFGEVHVFSVKKKPHPFLFRAAEIGKDYAGCAFIVAPVVF